MAIQRRHDYCDDTTLIHNTYSDCYYPVLNNECLRVLKEAIQEKRLQFTD